MLSAIRPGTSSPGLLEYDFEQARKEAEYARNQISRENAEAPLAKKRESLSSKRIGPEALGTAEAATTARDEARP